MDIDHKSFFVLWNGTEDGLTRDDRERWIESTAQGNTYSMTWSFGRGYGEPTLGDTVYLLQTGRVRGVVASGTITSEAPWSEAHWSGSGTASYVGVDWDLMLDDDQRLSTEVLMNGLEDFKFPVLGSGRRVHEPSASTLRTMWEDHVETIAKSQKNPWLGGRTSTMGRTSGPVPLQRDTVHTYNVAGFASYEAVRAEADLVDEFVAHLQAGGSHVLGYRM
ncbi:hypothetical protein [Rhodococcus sp. MEB041]|uniref:hypothetical protein n=1 Tax=Rhodococcus sp. MEB041 TaxID=3040323 RepID=UPI0025512065|nr:hypothetical protein [Rhodococcus sp. MEB041]